jgi:glycosyltransferase involved in cell wall biosynthesis
MKKVLIITYYWPPSGGSGVQRWLKFVKYLPAFGWEPHVFTPENPSFAVKDPSLEKDIPAEAEVMRFPIWEPYDIFDMMRRWLSGKEGASPGFVPSGQSTFFQKVSTWIRGNFFIPDPRRFWVKPAAAFLSGYLKDNEIDTIITTGPPHSLHLIGLRLKTKHRELRWLADFRDPWSEWGLLDSLLVSGLVRRIHRRLENKVLRAADELITITPFYVRRFEQLANRRVRLLTNGFDEEDFNRMRYSKAEQFIIRHVGVVNEKCDPRPFMRALEIEMEADVDFAADVRVEFIGEVHPDFKEYIASCGALKKVTRFCGNIPHSQLIALYGSSSMLLLILTGYKDAEGFLPGKLFEYLATRLPVLAVGPVTGDAATVLNETGCGVMVASEDVKGIREALAKTYQNWKRNQTTPVHWNQIQRFSRKEITIDLARILSMR